MKGKGGWGVGNVRRWDDWEDLEIGGKSVLEKGLGVKE